MRMSLPTAMPPLVERLQASLPRRNRPHKQQQSRHQRPRQSMSQLTGPRRTKALANSMAHRLQEITPQGAKPGSRSVKTSFK